MRTIRTIRTEKKALFDVVNNVLIFFGAVGLGFILLTSKGKRWKGNKKKKNKYTGYRSNGASGKARFFGKKYDLPT